MENLIAAEYFTEQEVCKIMRLKQSTLAGRISRGTEHPPYVEIGRERYYPKKMFFEWAQKRPVIWSVKDAS